MGSKNVYIKIFYVWFVLYVRNKKKNSDLLIFFRSTNFEDFQNTLLV